MDRILSAANLVQHGVMEFIEQAIEQSTTCRECGEPVKFFERYCPTCGQFGPARLSLKACLLMFGLPIFLVSIYLGVKHVL